MSEPHGGAPATLMTSKSNAKRQRLAARTALACSFCRQRKIRCSGDWPSCEICRSRRITCDYPGHPRGRDSRGVQESSQGSQDVELPSDSLRRKAIAYFRENYAPTLLCFIPPQKLMEDDTGSRFQLSLMLSILALVSRFISDFTYAGNHATPSDYYAEHARRELTRSHDEPSLATTQACLILCIYEIGQGAEHRAWLRLRHAVGLAQLLKLHLLDVDGGRIEWGAAPPSTSVTETESKRRTFWCCFCLDKLLANGRDRIAAISLDTVSTRLPQSEADFIYGRDTNANWLNKSHRMQSHPAGSDESLFSFTVRVIDILGHVMAWHGVGGRFHDSRKPWLAGMPFGDLDESLIRWRMSLPQHLDYTPRNTSLVIAAGQGRLWIMMFMLYFQARASLHREYLPFAVTTKDFNPALGPCDGPILTPQDCPQPHGWWLGSTRVMVESANAISDLYKTSEKWDLCPSAYPFPGMCLMTAASIHVQYTIFDSEHLQSIMSQESSGQYLRQDMEAFHSLGKHWDLATHWVQQIALYYKLNSLARHSWDHSDLRSALAAQKLALKDGIMNYLRQIDHNSPDQARAEQEVKAEFDYNHWIAKLETSVAEAARVATANRPQSSPQAHDLTVGGLMAGSIGGCTGVGVGVGSPLQVGIVPLDLQNLGSGWMFEGWDSWNIEGWEVSL